MAERTITLTIDAGELDGQQQLSWSTPRSKVDQYGALGIGDGFGLLSVRVNGGVAAHLVIREDIEGTLTLDVTDRTGLTVWRCPLEDT